MKLDRLKNFDEILSRLEKEYKSIARDSGTARVLELGCLGLDDKATDALVNLETAGSWRMNVADKAAAAERLDRMQKLDPSWATDIIPHVKGAHGLRAFILEKYSGG